MYNQQDPVFCDSCHAELKRTFKYCPICGKRRNIGESKTFPPYEPYYGDERILRIYVCFDCDRKWYTDTINPEHNLSHYCPRCGGDNIMTEGTAIID